MTKNAFIAALSTKLAGLPAEDLQRSLEYYSEYIADAIEDGKSEEEAVAALGSPADIAAQILSEISLVKLAKNKLKPQRALRVWEIVLLALGSPIWLSLLVAVIAVVISVYAALWSVVASLFAATVALGAAALGGTVTAVCGLFTGQVGAGLFILGCAVSAAGLAILFVYLSLFTAKGVILLGKKFWLGLKRLVMKKEVRA